MPSSSANNVNTSSGRVVRRATGTTATPSTAARGGAVAVRGPRGRGRGRGTAAVARAGEYGDLVDSSEVHPEIRELGDEVKRVLQQRAQRHATSEEQVLFGVRHFGPSKASRAILNKENAAARTAFETGLYVVWRCTEAPALRGANNDFCARLGYAHTCFCGHALSEHRMGAADKKGGARGSASSSCAWPCGTAGCGCARFEYVPNTPEEIGEGWLSRRANWNASAWTPKCRCGHGSREHDASTRHHRCRACGCGGFDSHFLCVVCDRPWEAHATVAETEAERRAQGLPVREEYFPLAGIDWDVREAVLDDATGGGALAPPARYSQVEGRTLPLIGGRRSSRVVEEAEAEGEAEGEGGSSLPMDTCDYCASCATVFHSPTAKFCSKCGKPRMRS